MFRKMAMKTTLNASRSHSSMILRSSPMKSFTKSAVTISYLQNLSRCLSSSSKRLTKKSPRNSNNVVGDLMTQNQPKKADDLKFVLDEMKIWKENLPNIDTTRSEQILTNINTLNRKSDHAMILDLQHQLSEEKTLIKELEATVANLQGKIQALENESQAAKNESQAANNESQAVINEFQAAKNEFQALKNEAQAHREDQRLIHGLLDIFHLFKKFILGKERRINMSHYSQEFLNATYVEIFAAIHPESIDLDLDNDDDIAYKQKILNLEGETSNFFNNIQVNKDVVYKLNRQLHMNNTGAHYPLENKQMKDVGYVVNQLEHLSKDIEKVSEKSTFANEKEEIVKLLTDFQKVYVALASPVS